MTELMLFQIRFRIHLLFWAMIGLSIVAGYFIEVITLFCIVLIHELGHVAVAREVGWRVTEVQLLPFGGVATIDEEESSDPLDEIVVALAGPFMNVAMIFVSFLFWWCDLWTTEWTSFFMKSNLMIAGFNLLPIWPLDGGRIVQALLFYKLPYRKACLISMGTSCLLAASMFGTGLMLWQFNLVAIAVYLVVINIQGYIRFPYQFMRFLIGKYIQEGKDAPVQSVMIESRSSTMQAAQKMYKGYAHLFYVRLGDKGTFIHESQLLHALLVEQRYDDEVAKLLS